MEIKGPKLAAAYNAINYWYEEEDTGKTGQHLT